MVQRSNHGSLLERAGFPDRGFPELEPAVHAGGRAAGGELGAARKALVIPPQQLLAERIVDGLVVIEATVETFDMLGVEEAREILLHVGADDAAAAPREARFVQLL